MTLKRARNDDVTRRAGSCWGFTGRILHATEGAGRSPSAARGAKTLIGSPNQIEAITANFEKREPRVGRGGRAEGDLARDWVHHA